MSDFGVDTVQPASTAPAGNPLAAARIAAGLSVADVGRQLKLSGWQVEALEAADYARLPGPVFVRGFLRNYARLLKIDPAPLLAEIAGPAPAVAPATPAAAPSQSADIPFPGQHIFKWQPYAIGAILVVAALVGYELYDDYVAAPETDTRTVELPQPKAIAEVKPPEATPAVTAELPPAPAAVPAAAQTPPAAPVSTANVPASARATAAPQGSATPQPVKAPAETRPAQAVKAAVDPLPPPAARPPVDARASRGEPAADERVVRMVFSRESWVEVRDRQGRTVFSQLNPAGSAQTISAQPPLRLVVGNATGVRVLYNDRPVDLAPYTQVDVARLTLE